jgi:glycosyltransferase involved in cell wall biosynthesis
MKQKICILTQSHLCRNPRVVKEANALDAAGYEVTILTTFGHRHLLEEDLTLIDTQRIKYKAVVNLIPGRSSKFSSLRYRAGKRLAEELIARTGMESPWALGYGYGRNLRMAKAERADLYICHEEVSTVIGCRLIEAGFRVAFDFEDWYSHDLLPEANRRRPVALLEKSEQYALRHGLYTCTTSRSLADALGAFAGVAPPYVLNNVFPFSERNSIDGLVKDRVDRALPSFHWSSQIIGPGRGLEFLVEALHEVVHPLELHLRGKLFGSFREELLRLFPGEKGHRLFFHDLVPHRELISRIAEHDMGLATEEYTPDSRNLTITNKILQYLLGGIGVLASDTAGQREVAEAVPEAVFLFRNGDRKNLAAVLNGLLQDREKIEKAKRAALKAAEEQFCWERQEQELVGWVREALSKEPGEKRAQ